MKDVKIVKETVPAQSLDLVVIEKTPGTLETNIEALELFIDERLKDYDPKNFEGDADSAKKKRAELNAAKEKLKRARIDLIKELMKPYDDFENRCKVLERKVDTASGFLDEIVKNKEQEEKDLKRKRIEMFWKTKDFDLVPLDKVFNEKWLNKTFKESDILDEMDKTIDRIYKDLKTIERYGSDAETLKGHYLITLDIAETIGYGEELQKQKEIAEKDAAERAEREHQEQLSKQKDALWEEQSNFEHTQKITNLAELAIATATKQMPKEKERKEFVVSVRCFDEELLQLKAAMNGLGIEFSVEELKF